MIGLKTKENLVLIGYKVNIQFHKVEVIDYFKLNCEDFTEEILSTTICNITEVALRIETLYECDKINRRKCIHVCSKGLVVCLIKDKKKRNKRYLLTKTLGNCFQRHDHAPNSCQERLLS